MQDEKYDEGLAEGKACHLKGKDACRWMRVRTAAEGSAGD